MRILNVVAAMGLIAAATIVGAAELGDPQQGLAYAKKNCAECHAVQIGKEVSPDPKAPSFEAVANSPGMTSRALVVWLQTSHPTMPNLMIPPDERGNLVAYIMSLRAGP